MANNNKAYISLESLIEISKSLQSENEEMIRAYRTYILPALRGSEECFQLSNVNISEIQDRFNGAFNKLNINIGNLVDVLNNTVIKQYSETADAIREHFNTTFANKMKEILGVK